MLLNDFFFLRSEDHKEASISATLQFNRTHKIFEGHFPGQPVVPGVCMMQMIKEIMEKIGNRKLLLKSAGNMKFLSLIDPDQFEEVNATISWVEAEPGSIAIDASLFSGEQVFFKMSATLQPE